MCQGGLAETRRTVEQDVVQGFTSTFGCGNSYVKIFLGLVLSYEVGKAPWS
jgi:hypothetical protein